MACLVFLLLVITSGLLIRCIFFPVFSDAVTTQSINDHVQHITVVPVCITPVPMPSSPSTLTSVTPPSLPPLINSGPTTPTSMEDNISLLYLCPELRLPPLDPLPALDPRNTHVNQLNQPHLRGKFSDPYGKLFQTHN